MVVGKQTPLGERVLATVQGGEPLSSSGRGMTGPGDSLGSGRCGHIETVGIGHALKLDLLICVVQKTYAMR